MRRIFIAINFSDEIKNKLADLQKELSQYLPDIRFTKTENIHLTLAFLGHIDSEKLKKVCKITKESLSEIEPFTLNLKSLGAFPEPRRAKIIWVGVFGNSILKILNQTLFRKLESAGFVLDERDYNPHITIGRARDEKPNKETIFFILNKFKDTEFGRQEINSIEIMESQLRRSGPIYSVVQKVEFEKIK